MTTSKLQDAKTKRCKELKQVVNTNFKQINTNNILFLSGYPKQEACLKNYHILYTQHLNEVKILVIPEPVPCGELLKFWDQVTKVKHEFKTSDRVVLISMLNRNSIFKKSKQQKKLNNENCVTV